MKRFLMIVAIVAAANFLLLWITWGLSMASLPSIGFWQLFGFAPAPPLSHWQTFAYVFVLEF